MKIIEEKIGNSIKAISQKAAIRWIGKTTSMPKDIGTRREEITHGTGTTKTGKDGKEAETLRTNILLKNETAISMDQIATKGKGLTGMKKNLTLMETLPLGNMTSIGTIYVKEITEETEMNTEQVNGSPTIPLPDRMNGMITRPIIVVMKKQTMMIER